MLSDLRLVNLRDDLELHGKRSRAIPPVDVPPLRPVRAAMIEAIEKLSGEKFPGSLDQRIKAVRAWYGRERDSIR